MKSLQYEQNGPGRRIIAFSDDVEFKILVSLEKGSSEAEKKWSSRERIADYE